ncbi:hypothetical protein TVAG_154260 [Trichomonas vaginalis G3]|uniref:Uncharacterized protein n=1 Tax=Trichomonas vaginalis (strain ATCC PRA-98 / G3) TaxID=412133 RepID=A2E432_TRIV3|nr:hypothetical protein TVAGG3_0703550 [Trichomonas vaginalis G3]EAY12575.1 hypothetical protein TVAG_154260 [Trichomonas vaginalis G3]KAI5509408.1 hypothetical protein TVAGG3_0703550 [Trichomonas vaginalis G3]|eukprot:XP_001324798.1 hypothetical protein [Trichomonas vaginalis G3]
MLENEDKSLILPNKNIPNYPNELDPQPSPYIDPENPIILEEPKIPEPNPLILEDLTKYDEQYRVAETKLWWKGWKYIKCIIGLIIDTYIGYYGCRYPCLSYTLSYFAWNRRRSLSRCIIFWNLYPKVMIIIIFSSYIFVYSGAKLVTNTPGPG